MMNGRKIICRCAGRDDEGNTPSSERALEDGQEWCDRGITCNRPWNPQRDEVGLHELEERLWLNGQLLETWNKWLRSPYCQCMYSSGDRPTTGPCRHCKRPVNFESAEELHRLNGIDDSELGRIVRLRAGSTWTAVYENIVRAAEVALKLLIRATGPAPENKLPTYGKHNLHALWEQVPECTKRQIGLEILSNHNEASDPYLITATGEPVTEPLSLGELTVFSKFREEFNSVRYAWDNVQRKGNR